MKLIYFLLIILVFVSSCKEDSEDNPVLANDYGDGMYIATENGVSFYNGNVVKNQIYQKVNGTTLIGVKKIKFKGSKAYIVTDNQIVTANIETFENKDIIGDFVYATDFNFVDFSRILVVDKGDSKVKVVDLQSSNIISDIETGDITNPSFIISKWYRSFVLNSGEVANALKDSTIIAIDNKDEAIPLADFMGSIGVGYNPNSAVWINDLKILCKGIYDPNNPLYNTESTLERVQPWNMNIVWSQNLINIYNAQNLISDEADVMYFFTAVDGIYQMNNDGSGVFKRINFTSDFIDIKLESYDLTDTTIAYVNMLYVNDATNNSSTIYKYNTITSEFCDTIVVDAPVNSIAFY